MLLIESINWKLLALTWCSTPVIVVFRRLNQGHCKVKATALTNKALSKRQMKQTNKETTTKD